MLMFEYSQKYFANIGINLNQSVQRRKYILRRFLILCSLGTVCVSIILNSLAVHDDFEDYIRAFGGVCTTVPNFLNFIAFIWKTPRMVALIVNFESLVQMSKYNFISN